MMLLGGAHTRKPTGVELKFKPCIELFSGWFGPNGLLDVYIALIFEAEARWAKGA